MRKNFYLLSLEHALYQETWQRGKALTLKNKQKMATVTTMITSPGTSH